MTAELISAASVVLVAIIEALATIERRSAKGARERMEKREEARAMETRLAMQMMDANLELGLATAIAVEEGKLNGEMKAAKAKAQEAQERYQSFIVDLAAHQVVKI